MLTDTQISSFIVPQDIWTNGYAGLPDLPPIVLPARDALDIERRAKNNVNIRNEIRRYTLCCERIQSIVQELSFIERVLPLKVVWSTHRTPNVDMPSALAYLALAESLSLWLRKSPYSRVAAIFFPPADAKIHAQVFEAICRRPDLDQFLERATKQASELGSVAKVTPLECGKALEQRSKLLQTVASMKCGLVDIVELR